jgi:hypothetical protein
MPAVPRQVVPVPRRRGSPTGLALAALAIAMGILAVALLLQR